MLNIKKGDVLRRKTDDFSQKVLSVMQDDLYALSFQNAYDSFGSLYTESQIKSNFILPEVKWVPKEGEEFYYVCGDMNLDVITFSDTNAHKRLLEANNCFKTKEEAKAKAVKLREVLAG